MLPLIAVVIVILFAAAAIAIDIARIHVTRSELRTATDAAARAGVEALGRLQSRDAATDAALAIARENQVAGVGLDLNTSQIQFGSSTLQANGRFEFDPNSAQINAVRVIGERTAGSPNGPVGLFIGPLFGVNSFEPVQAATATRLDRDIAMVLDVSGSMQRDGRFAALQDALDVFLSELEQSTQKERVSLTVYSTSDRKKTAVTENLQQVRDDFASEFPNGFTAIGRGLDTGLDSILNDPGVRPFALKSIIVMTDGNHNRGVSPDVIARRCADAGVTVHTITFSAGANQKLMKRVADIAGGVHFHADDRDELLEVFQDIARQLRVLLTE